MSKASTLPPSYVEKPEVPDCVAREGKAEAEITRAIKANRRQHIAASAKEQGPEGHLSARCCPIVTLPSFSPAAQRTTTDTRRS